MLEYRYKPLQQPASQIRVLYLEPNVPSQPIECRLEVVVLEDFHQRYEALSYTWGSADPACYIYVDGQSMKIGPNLYSALLRLRSTSHERAIWIDAICIDQDDKTEKNAQVPLMGQIYRSASEVIVWLGEPHGLDIETVFDLASAAEKADIADRTIIDLFDRYNEGIKSLRAFFLLRYWTRVWIIQELALARHCTILCGLHKTTWSSLTKLQRMIIDNTHVIHALREEFFVFNEKADIILTGLPRWIENLRGRQDADCQLSLLEVQRGFRNSRCTDPRDKVFGFLGLVNARTATFIKVDYGLRVAAVYVKAIEAIISDTGRLDFLSDCGFTSSKLVASEQVYLGDDLRGLTQLPSWAPDWEIALPLDFRPLRTLAVKAPFRAGGEKKSNIHYQPDAQVLVVRGVLVDEIAQISGPWEYGYEDHDGSVFSRIGHSKAWRIIAVDRNMDGSAYDCNPVGKESFKHLDKPPSMMVEFVAAHHRRLFIGQRGEAGLCPPETRPGDVVCIFWGCDVPIVLRRNQNNWLVIGEAYLHDHMDGQVSSRQGIDDELFALI